MKLTVVWNDESVQATIRSKVETCMEDRLIELHETVENAMRCRAEFKRQGDPPGHEWVRKYCQAHEEATKGLQPSVRRSCNPKVRFDNE